MLWQFYTFVAVSCVHGSEITDTNTIGDSDSNLERFSASPVDDEILQSSHSGSSDFSELKTIFENFNDYNGNTAMMVSECGKIRFIGDQFA